MESGKAPQVDEKTAHLIEEMEKSLHNMEKSLGPDHMVVSKILDSYAKLLRQNNLRHLDALNMEARAKAIRAKHNQKEAEDQSKGLASPGKQQKVLTASQVKFTVWIFSTIVLGFIALQAVDVIKRSGNRLVKSHAGSPATSSLGKTETLGEKTQVEPGNSVEPGAAAAEPGQSNQNTVSTETIEEKDPDSGQTISRTTVKTVQSNLTVFELAHQMMAIKNMAKDKLKVGLEAEKEKDFPAATQAYFDVIKVVQDTPKTLGRQVSSEEIAQCYEGYGRMAELDGHSDIAKQYELAAASLRANH